MSFIQYFFNMIMKFMLLAIMALLYPNMTLSEIMTARLLAMIASSPLALQITVGLLFIWVFDWIQSNRRHMHIRMIEDQETGNPVEHAAAPIIEHHVQPFQESFPPEDNVVEARMPINSQTEATLLREHHQRREQLKRERDEEDLLERQRNQEKRDTEHMVQWKRLERFRNIHDQEQRLLQQKKRDADDAEERKQLAIQRKLLLLQQKLERQTERMKRGLEKLERHKPVRQEEVPELPVQPEDDNLTTDQGQTVEQKAQSDNRQAHGIQGANCPSNQSHLMKHSQDLKQVVHVNEGKQGLVAIRELERLEIPNIPNSVSDEQSLPSDDAQDTGPGDEGPARQELEYPEENPKIRDDSNMSSDDTEATVLHPD